MAEPSPAKPVLGASEVEARGLSGESVQVGGRILGKHSPDGLLLADAFGTLVLRAHETPSLLEALRPGDIVEVLGVLTPGGFEISSVVRHTAYGEPTPDGEFLRIAGSGRGRALGARSRAKRLIENYFDEEGFLEVTTPPFAPSPGLDPNVWSLGEVRIAGKSSRPEHLITSPEFHMKRLLVGGLTKIYQFATSFRAEELGPRHEPSFTLLEWYRAFSNYDAMLRDTEFLVRKVIEELSGGTSIESHLSGDRRRVDVAAPFEVLSVREAFRRFAGVPDPGALLDENPERYFQTFVDAVDPGLGAFPRPVFLIEFPKSQAALARLSPTDPDVAERFELYVAGVEISNGYGELTDAAEQRTRFEAELAGRRERGEPLYPLDERFLTALVEGMPRSSGNALGFDRLVALALGVSSIAETIAFPESAR